MRLWTATGVIAIVGFAGLAVCLASGHEQAGFALTVGLVIPVVLVVGLLPLGIACPRCGHSIVLPVEPPFSRLGPLQAKVRFPSRRCRKCDLPLDGST